MKVAIGSDCKGFALKRRLVAWLQAQGHEVLDVGIDGSEPDERLMDYADGVAGRVARGEVERGVLVCQSGGAMVIRANRWRGVRAVMGFGREAMLHDRAASDVNLACFAAAYTPDEVVMASLEAFFEGAFEPLARRMARLAALESPAGAI